jgi:hypothetical protein
MKYDNPDAIVRIKMELEDHVDQSCSRSDSELGWRPEQNSSIGWCVGVHVADALERLFGDDFRLDDAYDALLEAIYTRQREKGKRPE